MVKINTFKPELGRDHSITIIMKPKCKIFNNSFFLFVAKQLISVNFIPANA